MCCSLAYRLQMEGEDVQVFAEKKEGKEHLLGIVPHAESIEAGFRWLGKSGYAIVDDESDVTKYRQAGHKIFGGNHLLNRMEKDRVFQSKLAKDIGVPLPDFHEVKSVDEAIAFVKKHPDAYCLKQLGHAPKEFNYVGKDDSGEDVIEQLLWIKQHPLFKKLGGNFPFMLQERVDGLEFAVGAWWLGNDWLRREDGSVIVEYNREHKKMLNGDLGISTGEMGTVMRFGSEGKLFEMMLEPLTDLLSKRCPDVVQNIDANCGVVGPNEAYLYEWTPRIGYPAHTLQEQLMDMPAGEFYANLIDQKQGEAQFKEGWCVGTVIGASDFPHESTEDHGHTFKNQPVDIEFSEHVMPEYLKDDKGVIRIADDYSWIATVAFAEDQIESANAKCVEAMKEVDVRAPVWRSDIGQKFVKDELPKLSAWGYL